MDFQKVIAELKEDKGGRIILMVADGLGGLPLEPGGPTELEAAKTPNLDRLARRGVCGLMTPIKPGITPGSGPGHLGIFGYDPLKYVIGRGRPGGDGDRFRRRPGRCGDSLQFLHPG
ncbi:MAG: hypothetical protein KatS3mg112_0977 [Thermogutta sp.]|nr:MAG: hypothetical protein KatS3mg112_0977 [Thermogutta sp.]